MNPLARARHVLARRPWLYWLGVVVLAAAAAWGAARGAASVDAARRSWGTPRDVVVATVDLAPGEALAGRVAVRARPGPMVPDGALTAIDATARARQHVGAGEVVVRADVAATAGPQALIPAGWAAVPVGEAVPSGAAVGDRVAVASGGAVLAAAGEVVGHNGDAVLVAVPADEAAAVAAASASGELTLLLQP